MNRLSASGLLLGATLLLVATLLLPMPAQAQFSAAPAIVRLGASAEVALAVVRVRNEGAEAMQFRVYLNDYDHDEAGDFRFDERGSGRGTCGTRLSAFPEAAHVAPGATQEIRVRLEPGMQPCWGVLFIESSNAATGPVRVAQRIGVRIVDSRRSGADGAVEEVTAGVGPDALEVEVLFRNLGPVPLELKGALEVRSLQSGEVVRTAEIGPLGVLPAASRRIPLRLEHGLPSGRYVVVPIIDFGADYLAGGQTRLVIP